MANDYFGYDKQSFDPGNIVGANMVAVHLGNGGGGSLVLAQSVNIVYQRNVESKYELGSDSVWLVVGPSSGTCDINRFLGRKGSGDTSFWQAFKPSDPCKSTTITVAKGDGACGLDPGRIVCETAILKSMTSRITVGEMAIGEDASYEVGKVTTSTTAS